MSSIRLDNSKLEQAISELFNNQEMEQLMEVLKVITDMSVNGDQILVPIDVVGDMPEQAEDGLITNSENVQMRMKHLSMDGKTEYIAALTSKEEHDKGPESAAVISGMGHLVHFVATLDQVEGIVINPWSQPFMLKKELIGIVLEMEEKHGLRKSEISGDFQIHPLEQSPEGLINLLKIKLADMTAVKKAYITGFTKDEKESYLLIVDFDHKQKIDEVFEEILKVVSPLADMPIEITPYTGEVPEGAISVYRSK